jgi:hypothetical protein
MELLFCDVMGTREKTCIIKLTNANQARTSKHSIILFDSAGLDTAEKAN